MWGVTGCTGYIVEGTLIIILLRVTGCAAVAMIRRTGLSMDDVAGCRLRMRRALPKPRRGVTKPLLSIRTIH